MLDLISCYHNNEKTVIDGIIADSVAYTKCVFPGHYSTTIVLNRRCFILSTLALEQQDNVALVWELSVDVDEPVIRTNISSSATDFKDIIPDIIKTLRKLQFTEYLRLAMSLNHR